MAVASCNPLRKVKEAILTRQIERALCKRRILELYLNVVELGPGLYGVGTPPQRYFGKPAAELGPGAGRTARRVAPPPHGLAPGAESPAYRRRVASIRERMARAAFLARLL